jgi:CheY-like chemotaxis protein
MPQGGKLIFETKNMTLGEPYTIVNPEVIPGDYAMLAVSDTGTGMTREIAAQAFEPFFTTKEAGKGSGLGLSMIYGFVKQSAGHIKIYSEVGLGTSVKIYLPRVEGTVTPASPEPAAAHGPVARDRRRVLVVEDNPQVLSLTAAMVESLGFTVVTAINGDDAKQILVEQPGLDLLLTDVMLPGQTSGPALAKFATEIQPQIKILFNSGYAEQAIFERGLLEHGVNLIGKPFRKQQLAAKIAEVLGQ